jgi:hypothetical protein
MCVCLHMDNPTLAHSVFTVSSDLHAGMYYIHREYMGPTSEESGGDRNRKKIHAFANHQQGSNRSTSPHLIM